MAGYNKISLGIIEEARELLKTNDLNCTSIILAYKYGYKPKGIYSFLIKHKEKALTEYYDRMRNEGLLDRTGRPKRARGLKYTKQERIRDYTPVTNMVIACMLGERHNVADISITLDRDLEDLKQHIQEIREDGTFDRIHERLIKCNGMYAYKFKQLNKEVE